MAAVEGVETGEMSEGRERIHLDLPIAVAVGVSAMVLSRIYGTGLQPYGSDSAQYIEHLTRLETLDVWRDPLRSGVEFLRQADGSFPPLMHLLTLVLGFFSGQAAQQVLWTGLIWLFLLAGCVAWVVRSISGSSRATSAAFCGVLLVPAMHGMACRYYYDLPMTAMLWFATALAFATWHRRPLVGGVLVGVLLCAANLVKWTALPFGLIMVAAVPLLALVEDGEQRKARFLKSLGALLVSIAVMALLCTGFIHLVGPFDSFTAMLGEIGDNAAHGAPAGVDSVTFFGVLKGIFNRMQMPDAVRLSFYPARLLASVFSPLLFALTLAFTAVWLRRGPRGWTAVVAILFGHWLFLILRVPPLDDRFIVTAAPALLIPAAIGWDLLAARLRWALGAAVLVVGFGVGLEFHFNDSPAPRTVMPTRPGTDKLAKILRWGLADSVDQRGWVRRSTQPHDRAEVREALWEELKQCHVQHFRLSADDPIVGDSGDVYWMRYRTLYAFLEEDQERRTVPPICNDPPPGDTEMALSGVQQGTLPVRPRCITEDLWELERVIQVPGGSRDLAIWAPRGIEVCPALGPPNFEERDAPAQGEAAGDDDSASEATQEATPPAPEDAQ
jgi:hypothetical protein